MKNPVFEKFTYNEDEDKSECKSCTKKMAGHHAENLLRHLKRKHSEDYNYVMDIKQKTKNAAKRKVHSVDISNFFDRSTVAVEIKRQDVIDGCLELVTKNGRPLKLMDDSGFKKLTAPLFKAFKPPISINRYNIQDLIKQKSLDIKNDIKQKVKNRYDKKKFFRSYKSISFCNRLYSLISLKVDCATRLDRSILGVNTQLIIDGKLEILTLAMKEIHIAHTGENLSSAIIDVLLSYEISLSQIYTLTVDNGRNVVRAGAILNNTGLDVGEDSEDEFKDWELENEDINVNLCNDAIITIRCACHTLQLAVKDFLKDVGDFLPKVRNVSKKLRTPTINNLLKVKNLKKAILDCPTRWNSTFLMCQRLLELKDFCQDSSDDLNDLYLSTLEWRNIKDVVDILEPVYAATLKLQKSNLTASEFYFAWYSCRKKVEKKSGKYCGILLKHLKARGEAILNATPILLCVYLDPRLQLLLTSDQKQIAKLHFKNLLKRKSDLDIVCFDSSPSIASLNSSISTDDSENLLKQLEKASTNIVVPKCSNHIEEFDNVKRLPHDTDIFKFWENHPQRELKEIAEIVLAIPATQVSVERAFSTLKFILSDQRASINENLLEDILLINLY